MHACSSCLFLELEFPLLLATELPPQELSSTPTTDAVMTRDFISRYRQLYCLRDDESWYEYLVIVGLELHCSNERWRLC